MARPRQRPIRGASPAESPAPSAEPAGCGTSHGFPRRVVGVVGGRGRASRCGWSFSSFGGPSSWWEVGSAGGEEVPVGLSDGEGAVGGEVEVPVVVVDEVVVTRAEWHEVVEVGGAALLVGVDVVDVAAVERGVAVAEGTGAVHRSQGAALGAVGVADGASGVEHIAIRVDDDRDDPALTDESLDRCGWEWCAVGGFADAVITQLTVRQRVGVADDDDLGFDGRRC